MAPGYLSRREFFGASVCGTLAGASILSNPARAAAAEVGIGVGDLPDLTIKEVKMYVTDLGDVRKLNSPESGEIISIVTEGGIEGNYTIGNRGNPPGFLEYAKAVCVGKNVIDLLPALASGNARPQGGGGRRRRRREFVGGFGFPGGRRGPTPDPDLHAASIDVCLWDIMGKAVNRPIYKLLGGTKEKMLAYASGLHLATVEDFGPDALLAKRTGYRAYKIHPGSGQHASGPEIPAYLGHMDEIREVRNAVGDDFTLLYDPVRRYNLQEALAVGRLLDEQGYVSFEDPISTEDIEGLIHLRQSLDLPIEIGEFMYSIYDYGEYIRRGAFDIVRLIADNVGGISGSFRIGQLADAMGMPCTPHNWGNGFDLALHFQVELALPNCFWFEMPHTADLTDRAYTKTKFRIDEEGYVHAPTEPGLGCPLDRDALENMLVRIDT